jgi:hypothetical protein
MWDRLEIENHKIRWSSINGWVAIINNLRSM